MNKRNKNAIMIGLGTLAIVVMVVVGTINTKTPYPKNLWKGIIAEAVDEGEKGMYAVACVYRNRLEKGMSLGSSGLKRKDLNEFVKKQDKKYEVMAKKVVKEVFRAKGVDTTRGATHYENVKAFGIPNWADDMVITKKIGNHIFYIEMES